MFFGRLLNLIFSQQHVLLEKWAGKFKFSKLPSWKPGQNKPHFYKSETTLSLTSMGFDSEHIAVKPTMSEK